MSDQGKPGEIPQSQALAEASELSLSELMSRDPEHYSDQDLSKVVLAFREQRERLAKAQAEAPAKGAKAPKVKADKVLVTLQAKANAADLDL